MSAATADQQSEIEVSVVLPCYNERDHIEKEVVRIREALEAAGMSYELIAIDDGSTDGTRELLAEMPGIRTIFFPRNQGSGTARRIGTQEARGRVVVWTDADMTYPNELIPELVRELGEHYDQVVGARTSEQGTHKFARVPAKWVIRRIASWLTNTPIPDLNSGLRAFKKDVARPYLRLLPAGFSCVTTITMAFLSNGHPIKYIPIDYFKRSGSSKFHPFKDGYRYIVQVLRMVMYFNPLRVLMPLGLWLIGLGFAKFAFDIGYAVSQQNVAFSFTGSTLLLGLSDIQIIALGLLADLVVRRTNEP